MTGETANHPALTRLEIYLLAMLAAGVPSSELISAGTGGPIRTAFEELPSKFGVGSIEEAVYTWLAQAWTQSPRNQ